MINMKFSMLAFLGAGFLGLSSLFYQPIDEDVPTTYQERACVINGRSGKECYAAVGGKCKALKACTPVPDAVLNRFFTEQEIKDWPNVTFNQGFLDYLVEIGWLNP